MARSASRIPSAPAAADIRCRVENDGTMKNRKGVNVPDVVLPLAVGGFASTGLLCLVLSWNEAFWALNLSSAKSGTLATLIASYSSPEGLFWAKLSAASTLAIAPILVLGWFCQKQLVRGLTFGAVK